MSEIAFARSAPPYLSEASVPRAGAGLEPDVTGFTKKQREACSMWSRTRSRGAVRSSTRCSTLIRRQAPRERLPPIGCCAISKRGGSPWNGSSIPIRMQTTFSCRLSQGHDRRATAIGDRVTEVQKIWKMAHHLPETFPTDGSQWDHLFADGERFAVGAIEARALLSPGHTLCSMTYIIGDAAFVHDTVFMPDLGTARADFPGGDALEIWRASTDFQVARRHAPVYRP